MTKQNMAGLRPKGYMSWTLKGWHVPVKITAVGGPYDYVRLDPENRRRWFGVCVRAEQASNFDVHLPIQDFSIPRASDKGAVDAALKATISAMLKGRRPGGTPVYVGCMGGIGRTGLFLALLDKVLAGDGDPIANVRGAYMRHAVETPDQIDYVKNFDVDDLRRWLKREKWLSILRFV
jgi:hypothetical protein